MKQKTCPDCQGNGKIKKGFISKKEVECKTCKGLGYVDSLNQIFRLREDKIWKAKLLEAKMSGKDISKVVKNINEARKENENGNYQKAKELLDEAEQLLSK